MQIYPRIPQTISCVIEPGLFVTHPLLNARDPEVSCAREQLPVRELWCLWRGVCPESPAVLQVGDPGGAADPQAALRLLMPGHCHARTLTYCPFVSQGKENQSMEPF